MHRTWRFKTWCALAVIATVAGFSSVALLSPDRNASHPPTYDDYLRAKGHRPGGGVKPREVDPATMGVRPTPGGAWLWGDHQDALDVAEHAADLDQLVIEDRERWLATQQWKLSHGGATPYGIARGRCMLEHASGRLDGQPCENEVIVVVHRVSPELGEVVYARPNLASDASEGCRDYSACVIQRGWIGREAPLPPGEESYLAFRVGDVLVPFQGTEEQRLILVRQEVERLHKQIDEITAAGGDSQQLELLRDLLAFNEWTLEEAEQ